MGVGDNREVYHLATIFEASKGHFCHRVLFVRRLLRRQKRGVGSQREVNAREALNIVITGITRLQRGKLTGQGWSGTRSSRR